ncbi:MAG: META domain-containing protein [Pseudonocardiales bacterium]
MSTDDLDARLAAAGERWRAANKTIADVDLSYLEMPAEPVDVPITPAPAATPRRRRMRALIGSATGIAAAAAAAILVVQLTGSGPKHQGPASARGGVQIVCQTTQSASTEQLQADSAIIAGRIDKLGLGGNVHIQDDKSLVITLPKGNAESAQTLCAQGRLDFRPLVMAGTPVSAGAVTRNSNPFGLLKFAIPNTYSEFAHLSTTQQAQLSGALKQLDCTWAADQPHPAASYSLACHSVAGTSAKIAYLLGPVVVPGTEIASATAVAPTIAQGETRWTVVVNLKPGAQAAWTKYTATHHVTGSPSAGPATDCGATTTPCADFVGVLDGVAVSVPVNVAGISGATQVAGNFTQRTATALAAQLSSGSLPVPLRVVSVSDLSVPGKLVDTDWRLVNVDGKASLVAEAPLKIDKNGQLTGTDGCNELGARASIKGDAIIISNVITTDLACVDRKAGFAAQVARLDKLLTGTLQWSVQGNELTLSRNGTNVLVYRAAPPPTTDPKAVVDVGWRLSAVTQDGPNSSSGTSVAADAPLKFDGHGRFTFSDGCNSGGGVVTVTAGKMAFSGHVSTLIACPGIDPVQTRVISRMFDAEVSWSIKDGQLTITKAGVGSLTYAQPSALPSTGSS